MESPAAQYLYSSDQSRVPDSSVIILFDGICNLCNGFVQFVIARDPLGRFRFCSLQSDTAKALLRKTSVDASALSTVVLLEQDQVYTESTAVLRIARKLGGGWPALFVFILIPAFIRNGVYRWVARRRYRLFGKRAECMIPQADWQDRFLS